MNHLVAFWHRRKDDPRSLFLAIFGGPGSLILEKYIWETYARLEIFGALHSWVMRIFAAARGSRHVMRLKEISICVLVPV